MLALEGVATSEEPTVQQNMKYVGRLDAPMVRGVSYIPYHTIPQAQRMTKYSSQIKILHYYI